jgi:phosphatidylglycerol:prolipoprotein diacylglycerol transferase
MRQVLFYIPLKVDWLPPSFPLYLLLLVVGLILALGLRLASQRTQRPGLRENLASLSSMVGVVSLVVGAAFWYLQNQMPNGIPIYGFGMMLFLAFIICTTVAGRRAETEGVPREYIQDFTIWVFIGGLIGARITFLLHQKRPLAFMELLAQLPRIWDGGIILYGSVLGALVAYALMRGYLAIVRRPAPPTLKLVDIIAPSIAIGLCLGRMGCFLNGCCYGQVVCPTCPAYAVSFPLSAPAREGLVEMGYQTAAGFTIAEHQPRQGARVGQVDPCSAAAAAGLRPEDVIVAVNGESIPNSDALITALVYSWPRGARDLSLKVIHAGTNQPESLPTFVPGTRGVHPTQLYEVVSMFLMFLVLTAYYPFRRREGQVIAVLMVGYAAHRYLNELLRNDPRPEGFERYSSVILFVAGLVLWVYLRLRPPQFRTAMKDVKS